MSEHFEGMKDSRQGKNKSKRRKKTNYDDKFKGEDKWK